MVSELHPHITEADMRAIFAPFGELAEVLMKESATQASLGVANITYIYPAHAKDAQHAINGLGLAGKQLVVQLVQDAPPVAAQIPVDSSSQPDWQSRRQADPCTRQSMTATFLRESQEELETLLATEQSIKDFSSWQLGYHSSR